MRIKLLTGLSGPTFSLAPGDVTDALDDAECRRLIAAGFAKVVGATPAKSEAKSAAKSSDGRKGRK